jgi:hypothetical protein
MRDRDAAMPSKAEALLVHGIFLNYIMKRSREALVIVKTPSPSTVDAIVYMK